MRNVTPRPMSLFGLAIGIIALLVGGWLIYSDFDTFLKFVKLFVGFFLLLLGIGIVSASLRR